MRSFKYYRDSYNLLRFILASQTVNGLTITNNDDGTLILNGTTTDIVSMKISPSMYNLKAGDYYFSINATGNISSSFTKLIYGIKTSTDALMTTTNNNESFSINKDYDEYLLWFYIKSGITFNNYTIKPMLNKGSTAKPFEQYGQILVDDFETFKESINSNGKQITASFDILGVPYPSELIVKVNPYFDSANSLLGSTMKCLEIEVQGLLPVMIDTKINNLKFGVKSDGEYNYINFGTYIVNKYEWDMETNSTTLLCYDKMVESMIPYDLGIDYSTGNVTILDLLQNICDRLGWTLGTSEFTNSSVVIDEEKFDSTYTFRSVLEEIGQVAGGKIAFKDDGILYVLYPAETNETIDESNLKTLTIGKKYGPVNSLVIARTPQEDNIYRQDEDMINGPGGKNLYDKDTIPLTNGLWGNNNTNTITKNSLGWYVIVPIKGGKTYTISKKNTTGTIYLTTTEEYPANGVSLVNNWDGKDKVISQSITTNENSKYLLIGLYAGSPTDVQKEECIEELQVEVGPVATEYEPFTSQGIIEVKIENNQLMDSHREDFIDNLFNRLKGLSFYTYELESYGIGYLELYDLFTMKTHDGGNYSCLFLYDNLEITQGLSENSKAELPEETETNYKVASESDRVLNKTILQVDKQDQEIRALITSTQNISGEMDGLKDGYNSLTQQVEQTMTSTQIQTLITETISNGVDSVTTSTGYTFNKDGLIISKTGEEMENKIDNTGMYVNRDNENILTANNEGVNAINLTARQYLTIGKNSRLEDYKTNRTACFYVGGDN